MSNETINKNEALCHKNQGKFVCFSSDICFFVWQKLFYHVYCMKLGFREMSDNRLIIN